MIDFMRPGKKRITKYELILFDSKNFFLNYLKDFNKRLDKMEERGIEASLFHPAFLSSPTPSPVPPHQ